MSDTPRTEWPQQIEQIMESVDVECGLCQNEGADDIAGLLREVYAAMSYMKGRAEDLEVRTANAEAALEEARRDAERYQKLCTEFRAENSKLRSALELVHFKREPWQ